MYYIRDIIYPVLPWRGNSLVATDLSAGLLHTSPVHFHNKMEAIEKSSNELPVPQSHDYSQFQSSFRTIRFQNSTSPQVYHVPFVKALLVQGIQVFHKKCAFDPDWTISLQDQNRSNKRFPPYPSKCSRALNPGIQCCACGCVQGQVVILQRKTLHAFPKIAYLASDGKTILLRSQIPLPVLLVSCAHFVCKRTMCNLSSVWNA